MIISLLFCRASHWAVAYQVLLQKGLPHAPHDIPLKFIVAEEGSFNTS
jgi:5-formyltetrahydrofolate cyclo-ligase